MEKYQKTNFISMVAEGGLFQISSKFWDSSTVVPLFITTYGGSMTVVGLTSTLSACISVLITFIFGMFVWRVKNLAKFQFRVMLLRGLPLLLVPVILLTSSPRTAVFAFLIVSTLFISSTNVVGVTWWDIMGRTIPPESRGRLLGLQQVATGIGGFITGFVIKMILGSERISDSLRFSLLFCGVGFFGLLSAGVMGRVKDPNRRQMKPSGSPLEFMGQFRKLLEVNPKYRRVLLLQAFHMVVISVFPFLILFEKQHFGLNGSQISVLVFLQIIGTLTGGLIWGELSKRLGNSGVIRVILSLTLLLMLGAIGCYFLGDRLPAPMVVLGLISMAAGASQMAFLYNRNYIIDITDDAHRALYLVMNTTLLFPFSFVSLISGALADRFGFLPVLSAGGLATVLCLILAWGLLAPDQLPEWQEELKHRGEQSKSMPFSEVR